MDTLAIERELSPDGVIEGQQTCYDYPGKSSSALDRRGSDILPRTIARVLPGRAYCDGTFDGATRFIGLKEKRRRR